MKIPSRGAYFVFLAVLVVFFSPPVISETLDYTSLWARLVDTKLQHFGYDCGGAVDLAVKGNFAYLVDEQSGLQVIDCTDPTDAYHRGFVSVPNAVACAVRDHFVYVAMEAGPFAVVDVDDHDVPTILGTIPSGGPPRDMAIAGPWMYIILTDGRLQVFSLATAWTPTLIRTVTLPIGRSQRLDLDDGRLYSAGPSGLAIYDLTVPDWPQILGTHDFSGDVEGFDVQGDMALVGQSGESRLLDVYDPTAVVELALFGVDGRGALLTSGNEAWLGQEFCWSSSGLNVFDISDPTVPVHLHVDIHGFRGWPLAMVEQQGLIYAGEYMCWCAGEWPGLHVIRPGRLPLPEPLATEFTDGVFGLLANESTIEVATRQGILVHDVSDPSSPQLLETVEPGSIFFDLAEDNDIVISCRVSLETEAWLDLFRRESGGGLELLGEVAVDRYPTAIDIFGGLAVLSYDETHFVPVNGLLAVDVSNPSIPTVLGEIIADEDLIGVAMHENLVVVSTILALRVLGVADPLQPIVHAEIAHGQGWHRRSLEIFEHEGRLLLTAARNQGEFNENGGYAEVFEITDPTNPTLLVSKRQLAVSEIGPVIWNEGMLLVSGTNSLTFYNWPSIDAAAVFAGRIPTVAAHYSLAWPNAVVTPEAVVTAVSIISDDSLLRTWPLPLGHVTATPESVPAPSTVFLEAAPNPFNPVCTLRYAVPVAGQVTVDVFDLRGRHVRSLLNLPRETGWHTVRWDGQDGNGQPAASGIYLARVRVGNSTATTKLTLAK